MCVSGILCAVQAGQQRRISTGNGITIAYSHTTRIEIVGFITQEVLIDFMPNHFKVESL